MLTLIRESYIFCNYLDQANTPLLFDRITDRSAFPVVIVLVNVNAEFALLGFAFLAAVDFVDIIATILVLLQVYYRHKAR
jgi:hypothetical protein